jgi:hypothetical protein
MSSRLEPMKISVCMGGNVRNLRHTIEVLRYREALWH